MFKGTNKFWKGLALLLVLCMLPTVALADEVATVEIKSAEANVAENTVTVTAEIGKKDTDITILAFRSAEPATAVLTDVEALKKAVVYIDQETAADTVTGDDVKGAHTFTFIPRSVSGVGKYVNIFVGGENVTTPDYETLVMAIAAPAVTAPAKLYKGQDLVLTLAAPSASEYDFAAWEEDIAKVEVNGTEVAYTYGDGKLTIANALVGADDVASIKITGTEYADVTVAVADGKWYNKEAGAFTELTTSVLSGVVATATLTESAQGGWADALESGDHTISKDGADATAFSNLTIIAGAVSLTLPTEPGVYSIVLKADGYVDYEVADITVLSPTEYAKAGIAEDVAALAAANKETKQYYEAIDGKPYPDDEALKDQMYGKRFVDVSGIELPAEAGATITWTFEPALTGEDGVYELTRSADADVTYTLTGTITKGDFTSTITKTFAVAQIGVAGVDITIDPTAKLLHADAAKLATVTLKKGDIEIATVGYDDEFKFTAVTADTYTVVIARPGYVTASVEVAVTQDGLPNDFVVPAMIAGDIANDDGVIHADDYMAVVNAWRNEASKMGDAFPHNCDVNGDGYVHADDYMAVVNNWRHGM